MIPDSSHNVAAAEIEKVSLRASPLSDNHILSDRGCCGPTALHNLTDAVSIRNQAIDPIIAVAIRDGEGLLGSCSVVV